MLIAYDLNIAEIRYEGGSVRFRYSRLLSEDGTRWIRHGMFVEYAEDGTIISEGSYVNGLEHGIWHDYHPNGQLAAEGVYENGREHGRWKHWDAVGVEESSVNYVHGQECT